MAEVRRWLKYVCSLNRNFIPDARIYAWLIKLQFKKSNDVEAVHKLLVEYFMLQQSNKNADVLRYVDIIGLLNIKKLIDYKPKLAEDLAGNYKALFLAMAEDKHINTSKLQSSSMNDAPVHTQLSSNSLPDSAINPESAAPLRSESLSNLESETMSSDNAMSVTEEGSKIQDISLDLVSSEKDDVKEPTNKVIDNKMETLKAVSSENLKNIRHSLLGLVDSYNDGQFVKK